MSFAALSQNAFRPIERIVESLLDAKRRERTVLILLAFYVVVWTLYATLAKGSQDIHFDMGEMVAWAREPALGTPKHPPLAAWLVGAWFSLFPLADWAFYLFAMILSATGLWIAWRLSEFFLGVEKRIVGLIMLTLVPFFNFHAIKFNANTVLIPLWAATTFFFLRSFETRNLYLAALAGAFAAAAMLGKYWSIVLLAGLAITALSDPRRATYFRSPAPWIAVIFSLLAVSPHLAWLIAHDFSPFDYAMTSHSLKNMTDTLGAVSGYLAGVVGYIAMPLLITVIIAGNRSDALIDIIRPATAQRRMALVAFIAPLLLPVAIAFTTRNEIISLWVMPGMTLLPIVLLSSPFLRIERSAIARILTIGFMFPIVMTIAAPAIALAIHFRGVPHHATHYRALAEAIDRTWHEKSAAPLRLIGSGTSLVNGVVFYMQDRSSTLDIFSPKITPWATKERIAKEGIAVVCAVTDGSCLKALDAMNLGANSHRHEVEIGRTYFGIADQPDRFLIVMWLPGEAK
jgi:hypothetical protein